MENTDPKDPAEIARLAVEHNSDGTRPAAVNSAEMLAEIVSSDLSTEDKLSAIDSLSEIIEIDSRAAKRELAIAKSRDRFYRGLGRYSLGVQRYGKATRRR